MQRDTDRLFTLSPEVQDAICKGRPDLIGKPITVGSILNNPSPPKIDSVRGVLGLGDRLHAVLKPLEKWTKGCGCQRRREWLNRFGARIKALTARLFGP